MVNLQYEIEEGHNLREYQKSGPSMARQARKQAKETSELLLMLADQLDKEKP